MTFGERRLEFHFRHAILAEIRAAGSLQSLELDSNHGKLDEKVIIACKGLLELERGRPAVDERVTAVEEGVPMVDETVLELGPRV